MPTKERKKPMYQDGQYMDMSWDDYDPTEYYVRGHVTPEQWAAAWNHWKGESAKLKEGDVIHEYGIFLMNGDYKRTGMRELRTYSEPGRGRFKISTVKRGTVYPKVVA